MSKNEAFGYSAQMGFTHRELIKGLASAVAPYTVSRESERRFNITLENRTARLSVGEEKIRSIASLRLPVVDVSIEFDNFSQNQFSEFVERFKKYLHRGGG